MSNGKLKFEKVSGHMTYLVTKPDESTIEGFLQRLPLLDLVESIDCDFLRIEWPKEELDVERDFKLLIKGAIRPAKAHSLARDLYRAIDFTDFALNPPPEDSGEILKNLPPNIKVNASLFFNEAKLLRQNPCK